MSSFVNGLNITISSILFKNSGLNLDFNSSITEFLLSSEIFPLSSIPSIKSIEPMLLVMMMIVFLKSTVLPLLSVKRPSSKTCNKMLNTSGCAFSISSNKITEYGFLLTASVS